jgi:hypothetical protein
MTNNQPTAYFNDLWDASDAKVLTDYGMKFTPRETAKIDPVIEEIQALQKGCVFFRCFFNLALVLLNTCVELGSNETKKIT